MELAKVKAAEPSALLSPMPLRYVEAAREANEVVRVQVQQDASVTADKATLPKEE